MEATRVIPAWLVANVSRKTRVRIDAYGTVDELNAQIGVARDTVEDMAAAHPALANSMPS